MEIRFGSKRFRHLSAVLLLCGLLTWPARAADPILVQVSDGVVSNTGVFWSLDSALNSLQYAPEQSFGSAFGAGNDFTVSLRVFGFPINLSVIGDTVGYSFITANGNTLEQSFDGGSRVASWSLMRSFLKGDLGGNNYQILMAAIREFGALNFMSGPQSSIGQVVRRNVQYGLGSTFHNEEDEAMRNRQRLSVSAEYFYDDFSIDDYSGTSHSLPINVRFGIQKGVRMRVGIPLSRTVIEGIEFTQYGLEADMSFYLRDSQATQGLSWIVTPVVGMYKTEAPDLYYDSMMYSYGVWTRLEETIGAGRFAYVFYYGNFDSTKGHIFKSDTDHGISEQVIAHALKFDFSLSDGWMVDLYGMDTSSLKGDGYRATRTYGGGLTYRAGRRRSPFLFRLGMALDESRASGLDYSSVRYECGAKLSF